MKPPTGEGEMRAPRWLRRLVRFAAPPGRADEVEGDLEEEHRRRLEAHSGPGAWLRTVIDGLQVAVHLGIPRVRAAIPRFISGPELRLAVRSHFRHPLLSTTTVLTLGVGIAVATTGLSLATAVLDSRLPFDDGHRWSTVSWAGPESELPDSLTEALHEALRREGSFAHVGLWTAGTVNIDLPRGGVEPVTVAAVTPTTLSRTGAVPLAGRTLAPTDGVPGATPVVVLRESLWRRRFGGDPDVIGRPVELAGRGHEVVGVLPAGSHFPAGGEAWIALGGRPALPGMSAPGQLLLVHSDEVSATAAAERVTALARSLHPALRHTAVVRGFTELPAAGGLSTVAWLLLGAFLFVVCANVANLLLARAATRTRELSVRAALGASRGRLVGQLTVETLVLVAAAAVIGVGTARWVLGLIPADPWERDGDLPWWVRFDLSPEVVAGVVGFTLMAAVVCGVLPGLRVTRGDVARRLRGAARDGRERLFGRLQEAALVLQMAFSIAVLGSAVLLARAVHDAYGEWRPPIPEEELVVARLQGVEGGASAWRAAAEGVARSTGVRSVAWADGRPGADAPLVRWQVATGGPVSLPTRFVSAGYFELLGSPALRGRLPASRDGGASEAVVEEGFARRVLEKESPLGIRIRVAGRAVGGESDPWVTIVGVVPSLGLSNADAEAPPGIYLPFSRGSDGYLMARVDAASAPAVAEGVRATVAEHDPGIVVEWSRSMPELLGDARRIFATMGAVIVALGALTLALSLACIHALLSFEVTRRWRELGIRLALGAGRGRVVGETLRRVGVLVGVGGVVGVGLGHLMATGRHALVLRVPGPGPWLFPALAALLAAVGVMACAVPLRRAWRADPGEVLRDDG
jgi:predicted permease